jgi:hypothetical protein
MVKYQIGSDHMSEAVLFGQGRHYIEIPRYKWEEHLSQVPGRDDPRHAFMTAEHHQVRNFVVRELPRLGQPMSPAYIAQSMDLPLERVVPILDDLEQHLFFLFRDVQGAVNWAYPITVAQTPYALTFSSGERLYAA